MDLFLQPRAEEWECHNDPPAMRGGALPGDGREHLLPVSDNQPSLTVLAVSHRSSTVISKSGTHTY
jgi:hypothetical protein